MCSIYFHSPENHIFEFGEGEAFFPQILYETQSTEQNFAIPNQNLFDFIILYPCVIIGAVFCPGNEIVHNLYKLALPVFVSFRLNSTSSVCLGAY